MSKDITKINSIDIHSFSENLIEECINKSIKIVKERYFKGFYKLRYNKSQKKYTSVFVDYNTIFKNFDDINYFLIDILHITTKNLNNILPIPILDGKYVNENICINTLEKKLIILFVNMEFLENITGFSYFMNAINASNIEINNENNSEMSQINTNPIQSNITNNNNDDNLVNGSDLNLMNNIINNTTNNTMNNILQNISNNIVISSQNNNFDSNLYKDQYKNEIDLMKSMGFTNETKIIESLIVSDGDIEVAINYYLQ